MGIEIKLINFQVKLTKNVLEQVLLQKTSSHSSTEAFCILKKSFPFSGQEKWGCFKSVNYNSLEWMVIFSSMKLEAWEHSLLLSLYLCY